MKYPSVTHRDPVAAQPDAQRAPRQDKPRRAEGERSFSETLEARKKPKKAKKGAKKAPKPGVSVRKGPDSNDSRTDGPRPGKAPAEPPPARELPLEGLTPRQLPPMEGDLSGLVSTLAGRVAAEGLPTQEAAELGRALLEDWAEPAPPTPLSLPASPGFAASSSAPPAAVSRPILPPPEVLQGLVEFAALTKDKEGNSEFRLGLDPSVLGGMSVKLVAYGERRLGLRFRGGDESSDAQLAKLVANLRARGIDIVDVAEEAA